MVYVPKIYLDTSVIGGLFDEKFTIDSNKLLQEFQKNKYIPVISTIVMKELQKAPEQVKNVIKEINNIEVLEITDDVRNLAKKYIIQNIITEKYFDDAIHIAVSTVNKIDVLVSWNFKLEFSKFQNQPSEIL
jgi:predicted nucleic acid-binding protein